MSGHVLLPTTNLYPQSSIGGFMYYGGSPSWRLLCQQNNGAILGFVDNSPAGTAVPAGVAKLGTPIVSVFHTSSIGSGSQNFYLNNANEICCFSAGGLNYSGPLKDSSGRTFKARSDSRLGAISWVVNNTAHVRIAYQLDSGEVQQINWDGNANFIYTYANKSPATMAGTSLAFVNQAPKGVNQYFRGYYQHHNTIMELVDEPSNNYIGSFTESVPNKTSIFASYPIQSQATFQRGKGQVGVYWVNPDGTVSKRVLDSNGNWGGKQNLPNTVRVSPGSHPLVFSWVPANALSPVKERIIFVGTDGQLHSQDL